MTQRPRRGGPPSPGSASPRAHPPAAGPEPPGVSPRPAPSQNSTPPADRPNKRQSKLAHEPSLAALPHKMQSLPLAGVYENAAIGVRRVEGHPRFAVFRMAVPPGSGCASSSQLTTVRTAQRRRETAPGIRWGIS
jgi:hypothetical protein